MEKPPTFIDLFCGAGGFTWGWVRAGFKPVACIDNESTALRSHELNFEHLHYPIHHLDVTRFKAKALTRSLGLRKRADFALIAGPPCQGWSKVGRGKLKSLRKSGLALLADPRNSLYRHFVELAFFLQPAVCVMENVPGMLSLEEKNIADIVTENFQRGGYNCTYSLVNAKWFGVPQERQRLIFIATRKDLRLSVCASGLSAFAEKFRSKFIKFNKVTTVAHAIRDLPRIKSGASTDPVLYRRSAGRPSRYSILMREGSNGLLIDHICRKHNDQDVEAFTTMRQGTTYRELEKRFKRYRDDIFTDKYRKLVWSLPSGTVPAHLAKDCYTHIHPQQARTISIREAARLQSFPDNFRFFGNWGDRFRQIGNAVPPLMAWGIAEFIKEQFGIE